MNRGETKTMSESKENKLRAIAILVVIVAAITLVIRLKTSTLEPGSMFVFGAALIALRVVISHCFNRMNQLPVKTQ